MKNFFNKLHYQNELNINEKILLTLLEPVSSIYTLITEKRNKLYKNKKLEIYTPSVPTISVGNITTGGTGKTPITAAIANALTQQGKKVAILSRGYGSKLKSNNINTISDGTTTFYSATVGGDEPVWLAENCPNTIVLTSANRVSLAKYAESLGCNVLILDDGFQHQKLGRSLNIAVIDSEKQFGNKKVLPAGPLREAISNLNRANLIIIVCKHNNPVDDNLYTEIKAHNQTADIITCKLKYEKVYNIQSFQEEIIENKKVLAFCAIGQPEQFYNILKQNNANIVDTISFTDHHKYSTKDIDKLIEIANKSNAEMIITTEKDAVKVKNLTQKAIYALKLGIDWDAENILNKLN